jgi:hypothetical protein
MKTTTRAARELMVPNNELSNNKVKVKIGATEKRDAPSTIYVQVSFWTKPNDNHSNLTNNELHSILEQNITLAFDDNVKHCLYNNLFFPRPKDNIFIKNIPDNLNYNKKRNYVCLELYLHTINIEKSKFEDAYPLNSKKDKRLYNAALDIANKFISHDFFEGKLDFEIYQSSKK